MLARDVCTQRWGSGELLGPESTWGAASGSFTRSLGDGLLGVVVVQSLVHHRTLEWVSTLPAGLVHRELAVQEVGPIHVLLGRGGAVIALWLLLSVALPLDIDVRWVEASDQAGYADFALGQLFPGWGQGVHLRHPARPCEARHLC